MTLLALPVGAIAQTSRLQGMALQLDYLKDYTGMFTYPSQVAEVGNLIYGEMGALSAPTASPGDKSVGAVLGNLWDGQYGTWAVHLRQVTPNLGQGDDMGSSAPGLGKDPNSHGNESFDVMWGKKFGTSHFGLRLNRSYVKAEGGLGYFDEDFGTRTVLEFDTDLDPLSTLDPNTRRNIWGFGGGLGFELNPNATADISILYQTRTFERSDSLGNRSEEDASAAYQIAGRAMWQWQPDVIIVPVLKFYRYDLSTRTVVGTATPVDNSLKGWQVGAAGNWTLGTNDLFVLGVTFAQNKVEQEARVVSLPEPLDAFNVDNGKITETMAPMVFAALETHVNNWLTLRFGANKVAWQRIKAEDKVDSKTAKVTLAPFNMSIGAGVKLGTLQLDAVLNDAFPQTLGGFFSNTSDFVSFTKVTATYPF